jgi:small subunit ribosomal protein S8
MDPIADLLVRIKNAQASNREKTEVPFSNVKLAIAKILKREGFIGQVEKKGLKNKEKIEIILKYNQGIPAISELKRVSKPGQRIYVSGDKIKPIKQGYGLAIISTSQGLVTDKEAKKNKVGGEILCHVW